MALIVAGVASMPASLGVQRGPYLRQGYGHREGLDPAADRPPRRASAGGYGRADVVCLAQQQQRQQRQQRYPQTNLATSERRRKPRTSPNTKRRQRQPQETNHSHATHDRTQDTKRNECHVRFDRFPGLEGAHPGDGGSRGGRVRSVRGRSLAIDADRVARPHALGGRSGALVQGPAGKPGWDDE